MPEVLAAPAPAAPVVPASPAPNAPVATIDTSQQSIDSAMGDIIKQSVADAVKADEASDLPARGPDGKFLPKDGVKAEAPVAPPPDLKLAESQDPNASAPIVVPDVPVEIELPEGFVAPKKLDRELKTNFKLLDTDGTELEVPEVTIAFRANGKERTASLDHVVKMAEWGVYNQEREQQWESKLHQADRVQAQNQQLIQYAQSLEAQNTQLLTDDNAYLRARAAHDAQHTPEARAQRAEQNARSAQEQAQVAQIHASGSQFFQGEIMPAVTTITKALPFVSDEEIGAKLLLISDRYKVQTQYGAVIPPQSYDAIRNAMLSDVVPWAQQLNDHREHERATATKDSTTKQTQAEQKARTAQIDAQKAKSLVGRVTRPGARGASTSTTASTREPNKPAVIRTVDDAEQNAIRDTLEAMRQAG